MIQIIGLLIGIVWILMEVVHYYQGEVLIAPIKGLMFGALYNNDEGPEDIEHTIQVLLFIFSFNFIWFTKN